LSLAGHVLSTGKLRGHFNTSRHCEKHLATKQSSFFLLLWIASLRSQ